MHKTPLTAEQQQLITEYLSDNYAAARRCICNVLKHRPTEWEMEDYIGTAHLALVKAARNFSPKKGASFATYAAMNIRSEIKSQLKFENREKRAINKNAISLYEENDSGILIEETIVGVEGIEIKDDSRVQRYIGTLSKNAKKVLKLKLCGYSDAEIKERCRFSDKKFKEIEKSMKKYERRAILEREGDYCEIKSIY